MNTLSRRRAIFLSLLKIILWGFIALNALLIFYKSLSYYPASFTRGFLSDKQELFETTLYKYFFYGHISVSSVILLAGIFQFSKTFRNKYKNTHRLLGKIYITLVLFASAPSAFVMGIYATGSIAIKAGFVIASVLWWYYTYRAYLEVKKSNIEAHRRFMQRSFIISLLAVFLRLYYYLLVAVFSIDSPHVYLFVVYASWLPHLLAFEIYFIFQQRNLNGLKLRGTNTHL